MYMRHTGLKKGAIYINPFTQAGSYLNDIRWKIVDAGNKEFYLQAINGYPEDETFRMSHDEDAKHTSIV